MYKFKYFRLIVNTQYCLLSDLVVLIVPFSNSRQYSVHQVYSVYYSIFGVPMSIFSQLRVHILSYNMTQVEVKSTTVYDKATQWCIVQKVTRVHVLEYMRMKRKI